MFKKAAWIALASCLSGTGAYAQENQCEARGTNGMVTVVLCPMGLDAAALGEAGKAACGDRKPCGAWLWDDEANLPAEIPAAHDQLPKASVQSALGIWVNEAGNLIMLTKN